VTPQSLMTVQNKIYECLAMGKPVVTGDGPAVAEQFVHGTHIYLVQRRDAQELADAMRRLLADSALRERLGDRGNVLFSQQFDTLHLGQRLLDGLSRL